VKKTRSERISVTVWFKLKYITQPNVTPVDQIVKAIKDLTCALKGRKNTEGLEQMEALQKLEELLTKSQIPEEEPRVTFKPSVKPPAPSPRVEITEPANEPRIQVNKKANECQRCKYREGNSKCKQQTYRESTTCKGVSEKTTLDKQQPQNLTRTSPINPRQINRRIFELSATVKGPKTHKSVGTFSSKRVWSTSTRSWNKNQRYQYNSFHSKESSPSRSDKRRDVQEFQL
jgi:hypothetical protein